MEWNESEIKPNQCWRTDKKRSNKCNKHINIRFRISNLKNFQNCRRTENNLT